LSQPHVLHPLHYLHLHLHSTLLTPNKTDTRNKHQGQCTKQYARSKTAPANNGLPPCHLSELHHTPMILDYHSKYPRHPQDSLRGSSTQQKVLPLNRTTTSHVIVQYYPFVRLPRFSPDIHNNNKHLHTTTLPLHLPHVTNKMRQMGPRLPSTISLNTSRHKSRLAILKAKSKSTNQSLHAWIKHTIQSQAIVIIIPSIPRPITPSHTTIFKVQTYFDTITSYDLYLLHDLVHAVHYISTPCY
jgi:hypothetical protein